MKSNLKLLNKDLRRQIVNMIRKSKEGHIPSSFSIVDIIDHLYGEVLRYKVDNPDWSETKVTKTANEMTEIIWKKNYRRIKR